MSTVRRSSRLAAKKSIQTQTKEQPKIKTIDLEEAPMKVTVPKPIPQLVDYDSDDSERTISDVVTLPAKPAKPVQAVKPVEAVKPVVEVKMEIKKEPVVKDIPMPALNPEVSFVYNKNPMPALEPFEEFKQEYVPSFVFDKNKVCNCALCQLAKKTVPTIPTMKPTQCSCGICSTVSNKAGTVVGEIKNYLKRVESTVGTFNKIAVTIQLFEYIDKYFEYIHSREFSNYTNSSKLLKTIHTKSLTLQDDINRVIATRTNQGALYINDRSMCEKCLKLLNKVHTKCHLYGSLQIDHTNLLEDSIYKKFITAYMDDFISKA